MKYEVAAVGGDGRAAPPRHNRVIFTRDLGGDFAREERAAPLPSRVRGLSLLVPSSGSSSSPPAPSSTRLAREI